MNILVLPDSHARPGVNPRRFRWLLKYLQDTSPDMLLCLGDLADMPSLSSYDGSSLTGNGKRKASFDGRTVAADIQAANVALRILGEWKGKKVFLMGNHEARIDRALDNVPELQGTLSTANLFLHGWEVVPFLEEYEVKGMAASHYFVTGVMGKSVGGEYPAATLLKKQYRSCIMGHSHIWDVAVRKGRNKMMGLVAGCYLDPTQKEGYAGPAQSMWTSGVTLLKGVSGGFPQDGWEFISTRSLEQTYG